MVRVSGQVRGSTASTSIAGGFVLVPVASLVGAWRACRSRPLGVGDFRTWLACREMVARRLAGPGRPPSFDFPELARLLGVTPKRARASARRLVDAGLIEWSGAAIDFPVRPLESDQVVVDSIGRGCGSVAIPRRILRFSAAGARPALIATSLGVLLRCLARRRGGFEGRGRVKSRWIAEMFSVSLRQAKAARAELVALGWIRPEVGEPWAERRWGRAFRIDLAWNGKGNHRAPIKVPTSSPIGLGLGSGLTPLDLQTPIPSGRGKNQDPAPGRPAGVEIQGREKEPPSRIGRASVGVRPGSPALPPVPPASLDNIRSDDLRDVPRLLELLEQAVARKWVGESEADRLRFVALAEHARGVGWRNPGGLFSALLRRGAWAYITQGEEDAARRRLARSERGQGGGPGSRIESSTTRPALPCGPTLGSPRMAVLSEDARLVKELRAATIRRGVYRDPFPLVRARDPGWTRERWDLAMVELGLA